MKTLMFILAFAFIQISSFAQSESSVKTETVEFKVYGNCGMCKSRIEKALKVDGVESAKWNKDTKMATVVFNSDKISIDQLHQFVAEVGHDTEVITAKDETYDKLHGCCKYERKEIKE
jgi:copper chaperone CopZ